MIKNLLLDRDGTIIKEKHYLKDPDEVEFLPGAIEGLKKFYSIGINLFMVTNQSGMGRGYFTLKDFLAVQKRMLNELEHYNVFFKDVVYCPHAPEDNCPCRKPKTGMWDMLVSKYNLKPGDTAIIGDKIIDIMFGVNAKLKLNILVKTGYGKEHLKKYGASNIDIVVNDLMDAYNKIFGR